MVKRSVCAVKSGIKRVDEAQRFCVWQDARLHLVHHVGERETILRVCKAVTAARSGVAESACGETKHAAQLASIPAQRIEHVSGGKSGLYLQNFVGPLRENRRHCSVRIWD